MEAEAKQRFGVHVGGGAVGVLGAHMAPGWA